LDRVQTVIAGAGVIGLAIARHLARRGHEVLVLEAENAIGQHTSSRNSGVIHAGIYYEHASEQQRLCLEGKAMLYDYCATRHVGYARCGKLTVAPSRDQVAALQALTAHGIANGVDDLVMISPAELAAREPEIAGAGAMWSPSSGIVDAPELMNSLLGEAESAGAMLALAAPLCGVRSVPDGLRLEIGDTGGTRIACTNLINAAGLGAWDIARGVIGRDAGSVPARNWAKGSYFALTGKSPFSALIYPMPPAGSLGVHSVPDLGGGTRFGPDLEHVDRVDYGVDATKLPEFEAAIRRFWPGLPADALRPDGAGIRPRIGDAGGTKRAFVFQGPKTHGIAGLWQLFGFESPGLTACLAIARHVGRLVEN